VNNLEPKPLYACLGRLGIGAFAVVTALGICLRPVAAEACGGAPFTAEPGSIGADAQRVFISVHPTTTDIVTQIVVPDASADYGVLIPVPAQPTLDRMPVTQEDMAALDEATAPRILRELEAEDDGGGCSCSPIPVAGDDKGASEVLGGVQLTDPVHIGPVTAVVLTGETGTAVNEWLADNGFAMAEPSRAIVDEYSGPGKYFIAIRRNVAAVGGPSSIGIHFSLPGDQRAFPMRFASIGAAPTVALTLFVAAPTFVAPSPPFAALVLQDLDAGIIDEQGYAAALEAAVAAHGQQAFVLERGTTRRDISYLTSRLMFWMDREAKLTRLGTRIPSSAMTTDVVFSVPYDETIWSERYVLAERASHVRAAHAGALLAVALVGVWRRKRRNA
jgi:hypothetical protein